MFSVISALLTISSVSATPTAPTPAPSKPYFMEQASKGLLKFAVDNRKSGVPESKASAVAAPIVDSILAQPQATNLIQSAASYYVMSGPTLAGTAASSLADKASSYYDQVRTEAGYKAFASNFAAQTTLFDFDGALSKIQDKATSVGNAHSTRATQLAGALEGIYSSLKADAAGSEAVATGKALAYRVGTDFDIDLKKLTQKVSDAKNQVLDAIHNC